MGQWPPPVGSFWRNGEPIEYPEGVSWDLSFVLTTDRKYSPRLRWPNEGYVADLFKDNKIDFRDLAVLAEHWLEEGIP